MARIALVVPMTFPQYHDYLRTAVVPENAPKFDVSGNGGVLTLAQKEEVSRLLRAPFLPGGDGESRSPIEIDLDYVPSEFQRNVPAWADMPPELTGFNDRGNKAAALAAQGDPSKMTVLLDDVTDIAKGAMSKLDPETRNKIFGGLLATPGPVGLERRGRAIVNELQAASGPEINELQAAHVKLVRASKQMVRRDDLMALDTMIHLMLDAVHIDAGGRESEAIHKLAEKAFQFGAQIALANVVGGRVKLEVLGEVSHPITGDGQ